MTSWVIGGGVAGISAAFLLRERGERVTLLEPRTRLGGRAFSTTGPDGVELDNGPHVILGVYAEFRRLLRRVDGEQAFLQAPVLGLDYVWPGRPAARLRLRRWPVPLAFPLALLGWRMLPRGARLRMLRGLAATLLPAGRHTTLAQWIARHGQQGIPRELLWDPLCRAVFNAEAEDVSAVLFCATLRRAFGGSAAAAAIWLPRVGWSELLDRRVRARFAADGIEVRRARVTAFARDGTRVTALRLADGTQIELAPGDRVLCALPWQAARLLLGELVPQFASRPIVSVTFVTQHPPELPVDAHLVALVGGAPFHFAYRRPGDPPERVTLLAGGAVAFDSAGAAAIEEVARAQWQRWFPATPLAAAATVRKEAQATVAMTPQDAARRPRPGPVPGFDNLRWCGDWTDTGLPCTLEGAALSARLALG